MFDGNRNGDLHLGVHPTELSHLGFLVRWFQNGDCVVGRTERCQIIAINLSIDERRLKNERKR